MTPLEIHRLREASPVLREALQRREEIWSFLREQVSMSYDNIPCGKCEKQSAVTLYSPYHSPQTSWCVECTLQAHFSDAPFYIPPKKQGEHDLTYLPCLAPWQNPDGSFNEEYDGPAVWWS